MAPPNAEKAKAALATLLDDQGQHSFEAAQDGRRNRSLRKGRGGQH